jgi:thiol-disulfide isomerase/thioredoxin
MQIYVFYSEDCPACGGILEGYLPGLKSMYPALEIETFDVKNPVYYESLVQLEKQFGQPQGEFPVLFIGDQLLSGEQEIMTRLEPLILEYQMRGAPPLPPLQSTQPVAKPSETTFSVEMVYFYQKGCPKCSRANVMLTYFKKKYPRLNIKEIDLNIPDGKRLNETLANRINLPPEKRLIAPTIFIGNDYLSPEELTEPNLEALIKKYEKVKAASALKIDSGEIKKSEQTMIERFKSLGVLTILSAGLIDGVNPCAFATLIFFISYLTMVGRSRREILWVGIGFSGAVFTTYLLIGFGVLSFVQHLSFLPTFSRIVYMITILIALILGSLSLYDYGQLKRGIPDEMKLQLPGFLKKRIHQTIRKESRSARYFLAAIGSGFIISFLEFTCTGQVYLPTILFVTNVQSLRVSAIFYLILYNFMFILPLVSIFGVVYFGVSSEQLGFFLQRRASTIKLLTALLFFALAAILILNFI